MGWNTELIRFDEQLNGGINLYSPDMTPKMFFKKESYNTTQGISQGLTVRYGISPIPGHQGIDGVTAATPAGLVASEAAATYSFVNRVGFLGLVPIGLGTYADPAVIKDHFAWIVVEKDGADYVLNIVLSSDIAAGVYRHQPDFTYGLSRRNWSYTEPPTATQQPVSLHLYIYDSTYQTFTKSFLSKAGDIKNISYCSYTSASRDYPMYNFFGRHVNDGDATKTATANCVAVVQSPTGNIYPGVIPGFNTRKLIKSERAIQFKNLDFASGLAYTYLVQISQADIDTIYNETFDQDNSIETIGQKAGTKVNRIDAATPAYADVDAVLVQDNGVFISQEFSAVLFANKNASAVIYQGWNRNKDGTLTQLIDLSKKVLEPRTNATVAPVGGTYVEDGMTKRTCWNCWPNFVRGTALGLDSVLDYDHKNHVTLGAAGSGFLQANTVYEITYSIYDKQFGYETNVGVPTKIQVGAATDVALSIWRDELNPAATHPFDPTKRLQRCAMMYVGSSSYAPIAYFNTYPNNFIEYRFYYRVEGSYEWLPAGSVDSAQYFMDPDLGNGRFWICTGALAALPGGQPGAFIDHSSAPKDTYNCVNQFRGRMFWTSEKAIVWSALNNIFEYPLRNSVACPSGRFKGFVIHTYPGQSEQQGRIIVFGTNATYIGRFTGQLIEMSIQVSPDFLAQYPVEGTDFVLDEWTSSTAFSYRSAIVADGILYFWGPQGIFVDNGVDTPTKLSRDLEPDIDTFYDPNKTEEIHCTFNAKTKEIIWFYPPRDTSITVTYGLCYNLNTQQFMFLRFNCQIDNTSNVDLSSSTTSRLTNGRRTLVSARASSAGTIQRGYIFDERNRSGDFSPTKELMVKEVQTPIAGDRRFIFDSGFDAANFATVAVNDPILIQQGKDYSNDSDILDFVGKVKAKGANYIDVTLPTTPLSAAAFKAAGTFTFDREFPLYISRHNQIAYSLQSKFWAPGGVRNFYFWQWVHLIFKVNLLPYITAPSLSLEYKTPISLSATNTIDLQNNSDGNCQIYSPNKSTNLSLVGQAIRFIISGNYLGHDWVLQYLGADAQLREELLLQMFEV